MANKRIKDLATTASSAASDDFMALDGATNGTRKMSAANPSVTTLTTSGVIAPGGSVHGANGAVGNPSFAFLSDQDTGLYRIGANNIGVAANGAKVLDIATTGLTVTGALGASSLTAPAATNLTLAGGSSGASLVLGHTTGGTRLTTAGAVASAARSDATLELQNSTFPFLNLFMTENPNLGIGSSREGGIAFHGYDAGGVLNKVASISGAYAVTTAGASKGVFRINATTNGADTVVARFFQDGISLFGSSDTTSPGSNIVALGGDMTLGNASTLLSGSTAGRLALTHVGGSGPIIQMFGGATQYAYFEGNNGGALALSSVSGAVLIRPANDTKVTFGTTGAVRFHAYGAGAATFDSSGNITSVSDARLKNITGTFTKGLAEIVKLTPKLYTWKAETGLVTDDINATLIAQDLIAAGLPEAVSTYRTVPVMEDDVQSAEDIAAGNPVTQHAKLDADGKPVTERIEANYSVSDRTVIAALVNAVKELKAEIDALKT